MVPFRCTSCGASRTLQIPCEPKDEAFLASFARCVTCGRSDRTNWALYYGVLALKLLAFSGLFALLATQYSGVFWLFVPLGGVALWRDHRRFLQRLDLAFMGASVRGGASNERLLRP